MSDLWGCSAILYSKEGAVRRDLTGGRHFRLVAAAIPQSTLRNLHERTRDLLRIASSVYAVDRIFKRDRHSGDDRWTRRCRLELAVKDRAFWRRPRVSDLLTECLGFLTGDHWEFDFLDDTSSRNGYVQRFLDVGAACGAPPIVCLYSGGLDSAAGLTHRLVSEPNREFQPVTVWHRSGLRKAVAERQLPALSQNFHVRLRPLVVKYAMIRPSRLGQEEASQRSRSFLFCSVGGAAAWACGASQIEVYESGIGAFNLPLMRMLGYPATRSCHPHFFGLVSSLLSEVFSQPMKITLPFVHLTKAEVVTALVRAGLEDLARSTISCVHYPLRDKRFKRCGLCPACLFRRVALVSAGVNEDQDTYKVDVFRQEANSLSHDKLRFLKAYLIQISNLSELDGTGPVPRVLRRYLLGTQALSNDDSMDSIADLFSRYRREWIEFIARGMAMNMKWAQLFSSQSALAQ